MKKHIVPALLVSTLALAGSAFAGGRGMGHGPGARFGEIDTNKDGKLSLAELTTSREGWFAKVDANKDGVASQAELDASFQAGRQQHLARLFERDDANHDGRVTRDESHLPSAWFERADANHDGALTLAELTQAKQNAGPRDGRGKKHGRLQRLDQNGDGKIERSELKDAAARQFNRLDANRDGGVSQDEFAAPRSHVRGHHPKGHGGEGTGAGGAPAPTRS